MTNNYYLIPFVLLSMLTACVSLPENTGRTESHAFTDTQDTILGKAVQDYRDKGKFNDGFMLLSSGLDAFVARVVLAESAERSLDVQYYLYHDDLVGRLFSNALLNAANRGVRVRLLIDDMGTDDHDEIIITLDSHPNIELRIFNPFDRDISRTIQFITRAGSVTRRMHNKSFTADNVMTIIGGRNIGNEYYEADPFLEFADLDVLAIGDIVPEVSKSFDAYWRSSMAYPASTIITSRPSAEKLRELKEFLSAFMELQKTSDYMTALRNSSLAQKLRNNDVSYYWGDATLVVDHAEKLSTSRDDDEFHLATQLAPFFDAIEKELIIVSPYFVPGDDGVAYLKSLTDKGVHVKILTNSLSSSDVSIVHAGYSNYRRALLRNGVELYEANKKMTRAQRKKKKGIEGSSKASLHAKVFVLDRKQVFIGSLNLDPRSFYENSEIGLMISSREIAQGMAESFDANIDREAFTLKLIEDEEGLEALLWQGYENGTPITFDVDPYTNFWRRFAVGFLSLLPIESQL